MEYKVIIFAIKSFKTRNWKTLFVVNWIAVRCQNNTYSGIILKLKINFVKCLINAGFEQIHNIILHTWKNNLCLWISETRIILKHLWSFFGQHKSKENDTLEGTSFRTHCINRWLIDMLSAVCINFFCIKWTW